MPWTLIIGHLIRVQRYSLLPLTLQRWPDLITDLFARSWRHPSLRPAVLHHACSNKVAGKPCAGLFENPGVVGEAETGKRVTSVADELTVFPPTRERATRRWLCNNVMAEGTMPFSRRGVDLISSTLRNPQDNALCTELTLLIRTRICGIKFLVASK